MKNGAGSEPSYDLLKSEHHEHSPARPNLTAPFSSIIVLHLANDQISSPSRFRPLKELAHRRGDEARHLKQSIGCLYSALRLSCFFVSLVKQTARTITKTFDFLTAS